MVMEINIISKFLKIIIDNSEITEKNGERTKLKTI